VRNGFSSACRSDRDDREETQFRFQNDLPERFNFQVFTSRIGAFREVSTVNLRVSPYRLLSQFSLFAAIPRDGKTIKESSQKWLLIKIYGQK
jgi:hypothetical protein